MNPGQTFESSTVFKFGVAENLKSLEKNKKELAELARKKLKEHKDAHPDVIKHWKMIVKFNQIKQRK